MISAHVRPFSKADTLLFYRQIGSEFTRLESFQGSQFYPFGKKIARPLAAIFPTLSVSIFFLFKKVAPYEGQFLQHLDDVVLETNFFKG